MRPRQIVPTESLASGSAPNWSNPIEGATSGRLVLRHLQMRNESLMPKSDRRDIIFPIVGGLACGGLERQVSYLAPRLKDFGVTVVVWSYREEDRYVNDLRRAGVEIVGIEPDMAPWRKLVWFRQLIGKVQPGVIHSYSYYTNFAAWFAALNRNITSVGSLRNDFTSELRDAGKVLGRVSARSAAGSYSE